MTVLEESGILIINVRRPSGCVAGNLFVYLTFHRSTKQIAKFRIQNTSRVYIKDTCIFISVTFI